MQDFDSKVAVITGAASGIGAALAAGFSAGGAKVVAADIDLAGATATADAIGDNAMAVEVDVADRSSVEALADAAWDAFGQIDLLFNNAGVFQAGLMWERTQADWDWVFGVNVYGIINGVAAFVPRMIAQDTEGHIVNTASVAAFVAGGFSSPYVVSKCAAFSLTECLSLDLAAVGSKVKASVLTPSAIDTAIAHTARVRSDRYGTDLEPALEQLAADSRLLRRRRAEESARRLPLRLLFPLVICILPAFILLTLAPVLAETLVALRQ